MIGRKTFLRVSLIVLSVCSTGQCVVFAQCVPDLVGTSFFVAATDTVENLPTAYFLGDYEVTVQMWIPTDTFVDQLNLVLPLDSIFITGVEGLPVAFTYEVYPSSGPLPGGSSICLQIAASSVLVEEDEGSYPLSVLVTAWSVGLPAEGQLNGYVLNVMPLPTATERQLDKTDAPHIWVADNHLYFDRSITNVQIHSAMGQKVLYITDASNSVDIRALQDGIYFLSIYTEYGLFTKNILKHRSQQK